MVEIVDDVASRNGTARPPAAQEPHTALQSPRIEQEGAILRPCVRYGLGCRLFHIFVT
jgi:hypothetical protein